MDSCRSCAAPLNHTVVDLGLSPVSNAFRDAAGVGRLSQNFYPLTALVCDQCWLVQLSDVETPAHFNEDYAYFSSHSRSWLEHAERYAREITDRLKLDSGSLVVELASNDGYLLQYFKAKGVRTLGVEPSANVAQYARDHHGLECVVDFFGERLAQSLRDQGRVADLIAGNNVLAHVPDVNDFVAGVAVLLASDGTATFEFPHLLRLLGECQFDTIYHEHFSYLSLLAVEQVFNRHGLRVYGAEELPTHGGSLRLYVAHEQSDVADPELAIGLERVRRDEAEARLDSLPAYDRFRAEVELRKLDLLSFLIEAKRAGKRVLGYGAPAKGNTLLNYCGVGPELLAYTTDISPQKQGRFLPGLNIPVRTPDDLMRDRPDYILILPWNLREEISAQLSGAREWGGKFVVAIPRIEIF